MKIFFGILLVLAVAGAGYLAVRWLLERRAARRIAAEFHQSRPRPPSSAQREKSVASRRRRCRAGAITAR